MENSSNHLWGQRPGGTGWRSHDHSSSDGGQNIPHMNDLGSSESIEDNTQVRSMSSNGKRPFPRQSSLYYIRKELKSLNRKVNERLDAMEMSKKLKNGTKPSGPSGDPMFDKPGPADGVPPDDDGSSGIYATYMQKGDGNMMVVCEPTGARKTTYCKQVGNNNVMINVKMVANKCQILYEDGKVFPFDPYDEFWLEIRRRRRGSNTTTSGSSRSSGSSDSSSDSSAGTDWKQPPPWNMGPGTSRFPQEHSFDSSGDHGQYTEPRWPAGACRRGPVEHYDSSGSTHIDDDDDDENIYENLQITEKEDAITVKMEAPPGGQRLTDFRCVEDCGPVQRALAHQRVIEFLKRQDKSVDVEMTVTGWEYEKEEMYSTVPREHNSNDDGEIYSNPERRLVRNPTLPPRTVKRLFREPTENSGNYDVIDDALTRSVAPLTVTPKKDDRVPALPPRNYIESDGNVKETNVPSTPKTPTGIDVSDIEAERRAMVETLYTQIPETPPKSPKSTRKERKRIPSPPSISARNASEHTVSAPWYHGKIGSDSAKKLLEKKPTGSFLVRDTTGDHKFTLEFVDSGICRRLKIWLTDKKYHLEKGSHSRYKEFDSVEALMDAAMKSGIEVRDSKTETWKIVKIKPVLTTNSSC